MEGLYDRSTDMEIGAPVREGDIPITDVPDRVPDRVPEEVPVEATPVHTLCPGN